MRIRCSRTGIVVLAVILVGVIFILSNRSGEPSYKGRTLSQWLSLYYGGTKPHATDAEMDESIQAIKAMGTNCIPTVLKLLSEEHIWPFAFIHKNDLSAASTILNILGDQAKPAISALIQLTKHKNAEVRFTSLEHLLALRPDDAILVPVLISLIKDPDRTVRHEAAIELAGLDPQAAEKAGVFSLYPQFLPWITNKIDSTTNEAK